MGFIFEVNVQSFNYNMPISKSSMNKQKYLFTEICNPYNCKASNAGKHGDLQQIDDCHPVIS